MARPSVSRGIRRRRNVLTYDRALRGGSILTRVDLTIGNEQGTAAPTPITPLYALRLVPFFNVPKRPEDVTLRKLTICLVDGGTRTVFLPYTPIDADHNNMITEYAQLIPNELYESFRYQGENFIL